MLFQRELAVPLRDPRMTDLAPHRMTYCSQQEPNRETVPETIAKLSSEQRSWSVAIEYGSHVANVLGANPVTDRLPLKQRVGGEIPLETQ